MTFWRRPKNRQNSNANTLLMAMVSLNSYSIDQQIISLLLEGPHCFGEKRRETSSYPDNFASSQMRGISHVSQLKFLKKEEIMQNLMSFPLGSDV